MNIFGQHVLSCKVILFSEDKQFSLVMTNGHIMSRKHSLLLIVHLFCISTHSKITFFQKLNIFINIIIADLSLLN